MEQIFAETGTRPAAACETEEDEVIAGLTARGIDEDGNPLDASDTKN